MAKELKKRSEVSPEDTWATEDLYANDELWHADFQKAKEYLEAVEKYRGHLGDSPELLYDYLKSGDELDVLMDSLANYAGRKHDEDTTNPVYQAMHAQLMSFYSELSAAYSFAKPELVSVPEETYRKFFEEKPELKLYEREIQKTLRSRAHTLSAEEEKLLAAAGDMARVPSEVFSVMNNADLKFPVVPDGEGGEIRLTHGNYIRLIESGDRSVRKAAFEGLYSVYDQFKNTSAALLYGHVREQVFYARQHKYGSAMEAALYDNEIPVEVYKNLISTVNENMGLMYRYMAVRKKLLGVDELHMYDVHTPMVSGTDRKVSFEEAKKIVYEAMAPLGEEYRSHLKEGFENRWIDVYENEGKCSGAYSAGARKHPYVLMNYAGNLDSVFTLAHEMGHALHSWYSNHEQPVVYSNYKIFVAEVASTCNEALLMQYLLKNTKDEKERAGLLNHAMDDFRSTLYRQTMFAEFEMMIHEMAERDEALTAEVLNRKYYEMNKRYFGPDTTVDPQIALEWSRIPHFYYNFYVYQYATGYSAAMALSARILAEGESAVKDYIRFLSGGSSADALSLLKMAGVDMSTPEPIEKALKVFAGYLDEMEKLAEK